LECSLNAPGIEVGGDFDLCESELHGYVFMPAAQIGGSLLMTDVHILGAVNAYMAHVTGECRIGARGYGDFSAIPSLHLQSMSVAGDLSVGNLIFSAIDLSGSRVYNALKIQNNHVVKAASALKTREINCACVTSRNALYFPEHRIFVDLKKKYAFKNNSYLDYDRFIYVDFSSYSYDFAKLNNYMNI
jgi:hypothetical protein